MIPKETIHFVNDKQLCDKQYASYKERSGYQRGYQAGIREVVEWMENNTEPSFAGERATLQFFKRFDEREWQAKLKSWHISVRTRRA